MGGNLSTCFSNRVRSADLWKRKYQVTLSNQLDNYIETLPRLNLLISSCSLFQFRGFSCFPVQSKNPAESIIEAFEIFHVSNKPTFLPSIYEIIKYHQLPVVGLPGILSLIVLKFVIQLSFVSVLFWIIFSIILFILTVISVIVFQAQLNRKNL